MIGIVLFLQNCSNDYKKAQKLVDVGDYKEFYSEIIIDINIGDNKAKNLLIDYFFKAIQDDNLKEVAYYLEKQPTFINIINSDGNRAIDIILFEETINLSMLNILLQYNPNLNYIVKFYDMSPLQVIISGKYDNFEAIQLLLQHGADVSFIGNSNHSKNTPLMLSYVADKINIFSMLLKFDDELDKETTNNNIFAIMTGSYALYLKQQGIDMNSFYAKPISKKLLKIISSIGYQEINNKNMEYLRVIVKNRDKTIDISNETVPLIKWYIKTNNNYGLKYIVSNKLCTRNEVYKRMKLFAVKHNNRAAMHILTSNKS